MAVEFRGGQYHCPLKQLCSGDHPEHHVHVAENLTWTKAFQQHLYLLLPPNPHLILQSACIEHSLQLHHGSVWELFNFR